MNAKPEEIAFVKSTDLGLLAASMRCPNRTMEEVVDLLKKILAKPPSPEYLEQLRKASQDNNKDKNRKRAAKRRSEDVAEDAKMPKTNQGAKGAEGAEGAEGVVMQFDDEEDSGIDDQ